ncbi:MAG TPA: DmsC/YnfH family molybdoenzyme membrane anchor subunit [Symbiobacteriaceae bacterium]|jgi:anaerobic dimethyl sulfoxide reductase subunit C (anchor subunit)
MKELPLILFTVLSQAAVGLVAIPTVLESLLGTEKVAALQPALRNVGRLVFPLALASLAASLWHLGAPLGAYRAVSNFGSSWLAREIILMGLFTACAAAYSHLWQWRPENQPARRTVGLVAAVVGLLAVFATGMVYQLPSRPDWSHWSNLMAGFVTALLIGGMAVSCAVARHAGAPVEARRYLGYIVLAAAAALVLGLAFYGPYLTGVSGTTTALLFGNSWFWLRLLVGVGLPVWVAAPLVKGEQPGPVLVRIALVAVVAGELVGRTLFYTSVLSQLPLF